MEDDCWSIEALRDVSGACLLTPNLIGIGGLRAHTRVMPTCGIPPLDFGLSLPRAGAVFLASSRSMRGYRRGGA
jgi:hypothetical protein